MGPAVFNGGFSTFLAFALLMSSKSFVFVTFFKIFFLVVGFGLYHGLVFLPVVLRYIFQYNDIENLIVNKLQHMWSYLNISGRGSWSWYEQRDTS